MSINNTSQETRPQKLLVKNFLRAAIAENSGFSEGMVCDDIRSCMEDICGVFG